MQLVKKIKKEKDKLGKVKEEERWKQNGRLNDIPYAKGGKLVLENKYNHGMSSSYNQQK
jgi:hypothetical protein